MKKKNAEVQSRRDFFKKAAKAALPILGIAVLASNPVVAKAAEMATGCNSGCTATCSGTCKGACSSGCQNTCYNQCYNACKNSCKGACSRVVRY